MKFYPMEFFIVLGFLTLLYALPGDLSSNSMDISPPITKKVIDKRQGPCPDYMTPVYQAPGAQASCIVTRPQV